MYKVFFIGLIMVLMGCGSESKNKSEVNPTNEINKDDELVIADSVEHLDEENRIVQSLPESKLVVDSSWRKPIFEESYCPTKGTMVDFRKAQNFLINTQKDTFLSLKGGTKIFIPNHSFVIEDSIKIIPDEVSLSINEYYKPDEFLEAGLSTITSDKRVLETAGSLYISVVAPTGDTCIMDSTKSLEIGFPIDGKRKEGMDLYRGNDEDDFVAWDLVNDMDVVDSVKMARLKGVRYEQFMNGNISLEEYFAKNLFLNPQPEPKVELDHIYIAFDVAEKGRIQNINVTGSEDAILTNKITNVVRFMPQWEAFVSSTPTRTPDGLVIYHDITMGIQVQITVDRKKGRVVLDEENNTKVSGLAKHISMEEYYVLTPRFIGWINCDRFMNTDRPLVKVFIERDTSNKQGVFAVCRNQSGLVRGNPQKRGYSFDGLRQEEYVFIVSARKSKTKNKYLLEIQPYICGRGNTGEKSTDWLTREQMVEKIRSMWNRT